MITDPKQSSSDAALEDEHSIITRRVLDTVLEAIARHLNCEVAQIDPDFAFPDLGMESLTMIDMLRELKKAFGLRGPIVRELLEHGDCPRRLSSLFQERIDPARARELFGLSAPASDAATESGLSS